MRSVEEARVAQQCGVDLIDIKEPTRGSLGAADLEVIRQIADEVGGHTILSVALGELPGDAELAARLPRQIRFAKFGLAGWGKRPDWTAAWHRSIRRLPKHVIPVAVAYADWQSADAPDPERVFAEALAQSCGALLVDTFDKTAGCLTQLLAPDDLRRLVRAAGNGKLLSVVAGSLGPREIRQVLPLGPDYIAVRGAACTSGRTAALDRSKLCRLLALVHEKVPRRIGVEVQ